MKDTLQFIVSAIVEKPEEVHIEETDVEGIHTFTIHVNQDDMGKIIGKEGKVIRSVRNVMKIIAMKNNERINVTLAEQEPTRKPAVEE